NLFLHRHPLPRRRPHVGHIQVLPSVPVVIEPTDAHPRPNIFHPSLSSNVRKRSIAVVPVQILPPEIVHHVQVQPAVSLRIRPSATETKTCVVLVEPGLLGDIPKTSVPPVPHQEIRRPVFRRVIRHRIPVL